ncbi:MAG: tRNA (N6-isopentenyl adenosine(37)-C2)-methylthiotransferase MiaB [Syntrophales bacterium]|nr:tRNA (N6-isopentenyl adenosine(37)-C2)-methylthiotransferase MiaB [Syntrophales bacterium]
MTTKIQYYIYTFGCQMNVNDSEKAASLLEKEGYVQTSEVEKADLIIVNTCSVRDKAEQKVHSLLGRLRRLKNGENTAIIGVMGCLAQQWGKGFFKRCPHINFVCGTHNIHRIPSLVKEAQLRKKYIEAVNFNGHVPSLDLCVPASKGKISSYVTIMQGCNNFCSYCIVPYVRGREESRPSGDIIREVQRLTEKGVQEIILLGQNVNSYGQTLEEETGFPELLGKIRDLHSVNRIRFTTSHPKDFSDDLINSFAEIDELCEHIHLPVQSGCNEVLEKMRRRYTVEEYLAKVERLRSICPDISITSDVIVGFPGEEEKYFQKTIDLVKKVRFDNIFSFKYSDRPGVASQRFSDKIPEDMKNKRLALLQDIQAKLTLEKNRAQEGKTEQVLVEGTSKGSDADIMGRTRGNRIVNFKGSSRLIGKTVQVKILRGYAHSLRGEMI